MIYVLAEDETGFVKIGSTRSSDALKLRMIKLNEGNPRRLTCVAIADGDHHEERRLHFVFDSEWERGEWFRRGVLVSAFIEKHRVEPLTLKSKWPADSSDVRSFAKALLELAERIEEVRLLQGREQERRARELEDNQKRRAIYTCARCGTKGHTAPKCKAVIQVKPERSLSPFTVASRRVLDKWSKEQWNDWRKWFGSRSAG
jgi:hypothetical protein